MIKELLKKIIDFVVLIYPLNVNTKIVHCKDVLYSHWIKRYLGSMGEKSSIGRGCDLQGGGSRNIHIGNHTSIGKHCILGCWVKYKDNEYSPTIKIGDNTSHRRILPYHSRTRDNNRQWCPYWSFLLYL